MPKSDGSTRSRESSKGKTSLHFGYVSAVNEQDGTARVKLEDMDGMETFWLAILQARVAADKAADWVDIGDYVACLLDEKGEQGVILGCCYSKKNPPPIDTKDKWYRKFQDGTEFEYDRATSTLRVEGASQVTVKADRIDWNP